MIEAIKERKHIKEKGEEFYFALPFLWVAV